MKSFLKQLTPPFVLDIFRAAAPIFGSYDDAFAACHSDAYQSPSLVSVIVEKNMIYNDEIRANPVFDLGEMRTLLGVALANTGVS